MIEPARGELEGSPDVVGLKVRHLVEDLVCRQAGGDLWEQFRGESRDLLGGQPLPGELVVLVQRLTGPEVLVALAGK